MGMRAVAQNRTLAAVLGVDVGNLVTMIFMLNAALAAASAILIAPIYLVKYDLGISLGLKAFYAAIIGGFNQIRGAFRQSDPCGGSRRRLDRHRADGDVPL